MSYASASSHPSLTPWQCGRGVRVHWLYEMSKQNRMGHRGFFSGLGSNQDSEQALLLIPPQDHLQRNQREWERKRPNTTKIYFCLLHGTRLLAWSRRDETDWVLKPNSNSLAGESKWESSPHLGKGFHPSAQDTDMITERVLFYPEKITGKDWHIKHWRVLF